MARNIEVTPEQLESAAGKIEGLAADYKTQYDALYSETNAMASTWQGKDNAAFVNQIEGFKGDFEKMYRLMLDYARFLRYRKSIPWNTGHCGKPSTQTDKLSRR